MDTHSKVIKCISCDEASHMDTRTIHKGGRGFQKFQSIGLSIVPSPMKKSSSLPLRVTPSAQVSPMQCPVDRHRITQLLPLADRSTRRENNKKGLTRRPFIRI